MNEKNKIIIVGLNYNYNKTLANLLADESGGFFLDVEEFVSYTLFDRKAMKEKCGLKYLLEQEQKTIKGCLDFENAVLSFPCEYLINNNNYELFEPTSIIVYIKFSQTCLEKVNIKRPKDQKMEVDLICYKERDALLNQISDFTIVVGNKRQTTVVKEIINNIVGE